MSSINNLRSELNSLKDNVIGLIKIQGNFELVTNYQETNKTVDTVRITQFAALQQNYGVPESYGEFIQFPNNKRMTEMLSDPFAWDLFVKQFK